MMAGGGSIVATIEHAIAPPIDLSGDIESLKRHMSDAMDRMNAALFDLMLDTDDCVVERYLGGCPGDDAAVVWASCVSTTDASIIRQSIQDQFEVREFDRPPSIALTAIRLEAIRVCDYPDASVRPTQ